MRKYKIWITCFLATLLVVFIAGCGQETVTVPSVVSTVPANGAAAVQINSAISATFSMAMNPSTITASSFTVTGPGGTAVAGAVTYSALTATFTPAAPLAYSALYTATITTGAADLGGTPLIANYVWSFTTITPAPAVISTIPVNGATSVPIGQVLSATFSEAMAPATIAASTFTVTGPDGTAIAGTVAYSGLVATFTPSASLANSTLYTATITTGATDLAGTPLPTNYVWSFTTITPTPAVTAVVPLNGATSVPVGQVLSATFNEPMTPNTLTAATFTVKGPGGTAVAGTVTYSGVVATFTPSAKLAYNTVYTATITTGVYDPQGQELPAKYVWTFTTITPTPAVTSTIPLNSATGVPLSQVLSATFNETMSCATLTSTTFTVTGPGATAVAGTVGCAVNVATFTPGAHLAVNTVYTATITTGAADPAGTPLAGNYVWTFTTVAAPTTPTVISTVPVNGATAVPLSQAVSATFNEAMNCVTLTAATFTLTGPGTTAVAGTVSCAGTVATLTPSAQLTVNTLYTATISTGAKDPAGTPLAGNYTWTFTTVTAPTAPTVISTVPANGATGVPLSQLVSATFSEAMNCATLTVTTFTVAGPGTTAVAGTVACVGSVATFTPGTQLAVNTLYTATITTGAKDPGGTALAANYAWTFRTVPAPAAPTVISTVPINGATGVPINQALSATFSVAMSPATINAATFTLAGPGGVAVTGVVTYVPAGSVATFTPAADLAASTVYTATITTGAMDLEDTALAQNYVWTFTTAATVVAVPPTVISTIPANLATDVALNQTVSATFSKAMDPATINATTFTLTGPGTTPVSGLLAYAVVGNSLTFNPTANLPASTLFTATITTGAKDLTGTGLASNYVWTFTTGAAVVVTPPEIVSTVPANTDTGVPLNQAVSATFTEAMNPLTLTSSTFLLYQGTSASGTPIPATITYDAVNFIATLTPTALLTASTSYTATVTNGATDLAGNPLGTTGAPNPWTFTTGAAVVPPPIVLGPTISQFGAFGGNAGITNEGLYTVVNADIGTTGASTKITGFHDDSVISSTGVPQCTYTESQKSPGTGLVGALSATSPGTGVISIFTAAPPPTSFCPDEGTAATMTIATTAAAEALTAYNTLQCSCNPAAGTTPSAVPGAALPSELGGLTLAPGTWTNASTVGITNGNLTLDAKGDPNAYWIFQIGSTLTVGEAIAPRSVTLINGANAANVYWVVGSAAIINYGGGGTMVGTIISTAATTLSSPAQNTTTSATTFLTGRALALFASTTMVNTVINLP